VRERETDIQQEIERERDTERERGGEREGEGEGWSRRLRCAVQPRHLCGGKEQRLRKRHSERERGERERDRETLRERQRERQTDRQTDREGGRESDRDRERQRESISDQSSRTQWFSESITSSHSETLKIHKIHPQMGNNLAKIDKFYQLQGMGCACLSHMCFSSRVAEVNFPVNSFTYPLLLLI
jgi:hypothetical protein